MILDTLFILLGLFMLTTGLWRLFHDARLLENRNAAATFLLLQAGQFFVFLALLEGK